MTLCFILGISPYRAVNTFHHGYNNQSGNDISAFYKELVRTAL
jgi:hypothetical protein